jgi:hypothetical protein
MLLKDAALPKRPRALADGPRLGFQQPDRGLCLTAPVLLIIFELFEITEK